jgi:hypothetical protein
MVMLVEMYYTRFMHTSLDHFFREVAVRNEQVDDNVC